MVKQQSKQSAGVGRRNREKNREKKRVIANIKSFERGKDGNGGGFNSKNRLQKYK